MRQLAQYTLDLAFFAMSGRSSTLQTLDCRPQEGVPPSREAHLLPVMAVEVEADLIVEEAKEGAV